MDLLLILGTLLGIFLLHSFLKPKSNKKNGAAAARYPPEPAGRLPIIGHLRILAKEEGLLATLGALAEKHGSIFGVSIGSQRTVVVSSAELAKECLTTHDKILATRSKSAAGKYLAPNYTVFSLCEYGPYWRKIRKIATQELLSFSQIKLSKHFRTQEVNLGMTHLYKQWAETGGAAPVLVEMSNWFRELMFNIMVMSIVGKRYFGPNIAAEEQEAALRFQRAVRQLVHLMGVLIVSDAIPSLEWLDLGGHIAALTKTAKEMDSVLTIWLEEHRQCTASGKSKDQPDFIDIMFSIFEGTNDFFEHDPNTVIKSTALEPKSYIISRQIPINTLATCTPKEYNPPEWGKMCGHKYGDPPRNRPTQEANSGSQLRKPTQEANSGSQLRKPTQEANQGSQLRKPTQEANQGSQLRKPTQEAN